MLSPFVEPPYCRQLRVDDLLGILYDHKPNDAFCIIGVTMEDLYEGKDDSFVVGMAAGGSGNAIFSFYRYHPQYEHLKQQQDEEEAEDEDENNNNKKKKRKRKGDAKNKKQQDEEDQMVLFSRSCKVSRE